MTGKFASSRTTKLAIGILIFVQISACTGVSELVVSRPDIVASTGIESSGKIDLGDAQIYLRPTNQIDTGEGTNWFGVNVIKPVRNETWSSFYYDRKFPEILASSSVRPFYLELFIETEKELRLHPSSMFVQSGDQRAAPVSYLGPLLLRSKVNYALPLCTPDKTKMRSISSPISFAAGKTTCLALVFDMPAPDPTQRFQLELGEIDLGSKKIKMPQFFSHRVERPTHILSLLL